MASAQTIESSQKYSEFLVTDTQKDTTALHMQCLPCIVWVIPALCAPGGWLQSGLKITRVYNGTVSPQDYFCCYLLPLAFSWLCDESQPSFPYCPLFPKLFIVGCCCLQPGSLAGTCCKENNKSGWVITEDIKER